MVRTWSLLVADDEEGFRELLRQRLQRKGYTVTAVADGTGALAALAAEEFDAAIFDLKMPGADGITVLRKAREVQPTLPVLILTGHGSIETAIEAIRAGAYDYLTKPCNLTELELLLQKALERRALESQNQSLRAVLRRQEGDLHIVGGSTAIAKLRQLTERVAQSQTAGPVGGEKRHRQGTGRPGRAHPEPPGGGAVRARQLRRPAWAVTGE